MLLAATGSAAPGPRGAPVRVYGNMSWITLDRASVEKGRGGRHAFLRNYDTNA